MRKKIQYIWSLVVVSACFVANEALMACSTCSATFSQDKINAYKISTALLVFLPFTITGLIIFYVVKKSKARISEENVD